MFLLRKLPAKKRRLLIARTDRIGDFISTIPMFQALNETGYDDVSVLCREDNAPLIQGNPYLKETFFVDPENPRRILESIKYRRFDTLIVAVNDDLILTLLPKLRFIPERVGPLSTLRCFAYYNYPVVQKRSLSVANEARYNLDLLNVLGIRAPVSRPRIYLTDEEKKTARQNVQARFSGQTNQNTQRPLVILHQSMRGSALNIRPEYYVQLTRLLLAKGILVGLTGHSPEDRAANLKIMERVPAEQQHLIQDLTGAYELRRLCAVISQADALVAPSTGPLHIANAVGTKFVGIFSPVRVQTAKRWAPFQRDPRKSVIWQPDQRLCGRKTDCSGVKCQRYYCLDEITPDKICTSVEALLRVH